MDVPVRLVPSWQRPGERSGCTQRRRGPALLKGVERGRWREPVLCGEYGRQTRVVGCRSWGSLSDSADGGGDACDRLGRREEAKRVLVDRGVAGRGSCRSRGAVDERAGGSGQN